MSAFPGSTKLLKGGLGLVVLGCARPRAKLKDRNQML